MKDIKNILENLLKNKVPGFSEKVRQFEVFDIWEKAVGEKIAKHCWPVRFTDEETLLVGSDSSAWLNQLKYLEKSLLEKLEKELGNRKVKKLCFKIETRPSRG